MAKYKEHDSMNYEVLIRRSFSCGRFNEYGGDDYVFRNLIWAETKEPMVNHLQPFDIMITQVKNNIRKALENFLTFNLNEDERIRITDTITSLEFAKTSDSLMDIIIEGLDATARFKENMR